MSRTEDFAEWFEYDAELERRSRGAVRDVRILLENVLHRRRESFLPQGRIRGRRVVLHPWSTGEPLLFSICRKYMTRPVFQDWTNVCLCAGMSSRRKDQALYVAVDPVVHEVRWVSSTDSKRRRECFADAMNLRDALMNAVDLDAVQRDFDVEVSKRPDLEKVFETMTVGGRVPAGCRANPISLHDTLNWNWMDDAGREHDGTVCESRRTSKPLKAFCAQSVTTPDSLIGAVELSVTCRLRGTRDCILVATQLYRGTWVGRRSSFASLRPFVSEYLYDTYRVRSLSLRGQMLAALLLRSNPLEDQAVHTASVFAVLAVLEDTSSDNLWDRVRALDLWRLCSDDPAPHPILDELRRGVWRVGRTLMHAEAASGTSVALWRVVDPRIRPNRRRDAPYSGSSTCGHGDVTVHERRLLPTVGGCAAQLHVHVSSSGRQPYGVVGDATGEPGDTGVVCVSERFGRGVAGGGDDGDGGGCCDLKGFRYKITSSINRPVPKDSNDSSLPAPSTECVPHTGPSSSFDVSKSIITKFCSVLLSKT